MIRHGPEATIVTTGAAFHFPGGMTAARFLATVWQRRALACPRALAAGPWAPDADDLIAIAMEEGVEARLVTRRRGRYALATGPFAADRYDSLPDRDWTLLVQSMEAWEPRYHGLLDLFAFLPRWRFDDVMVSLAAKGGGVGPHVDQYDVFLVQVAGRRLWRFGGPVHPLVPGAPLRLLSAFEPTDSFEAAPGDVLYLPPGVPHDGVALEDGAMTLSVGFRAPGLTDLADRLADTLAARWSEVVEAEPRFGDAGRAVVSDPHCLGEDDLARARDLLRAAIDDPAVLARLLGEQVTTPRQPPARRGRGLTRATLLARLDAGRALERWSGSRLAWAPLPARGALLFADGESFPAPRSFARWLSRRDRIDGAAIARWRDDLAALDVLLALVSRGCFGFAR